MLNFIYVPLTFGIVTLGIYKLFELFVRKKERLTIIEKIGDKLQPSSMPEVNQIFTSLPKLNGISFSTLRIACLLLGIGLGLLVGFFICQSYNISGLNQDNTYEIRSLVYSASVLLFGGLSLLIAFIVEIKLGKRKEKD